MRFIGVSHILDFLFPHSFGNIGYIRFTAQGIALVVVVGVGLKKGRVFLGLGCDSQTRGSFHLQLSFQSLETHTESNPRLYGMLKGPILVQIFPERIREMSKIVSSGNIFGR